MTSPEKRILCSTGTMVGRENNYDLARAADTIARFCDDGLILGGELMMLRHYYDKKDSVTSIIKDSGAPFPIIHCEKDVGSELSQAAYHLSEHDYMGEEEFFSQAMRHFRLNCSFAESIGAKMMVLHLWGGRCSDSHVEYNCEKLYELASTAYSHGVRLLIENVPSTTHDPLSNWRLASDSFPGVAFIFDSRFGALHAQTKETLTDPLVQFNLAHVHVSDFVGGYRDFKALRPILHPGEGVVDFTELSALLKAFDYSGTVTLESPVMKGEDIDVDKLKSSLKFVSDLLR